jgi:hypothetical protein
LPPFHDAPPPGNINELGLPLLPQSSFAHPALQDVTFEAHALPEGFPAAPQIYPPRLDRRVLLKSPFAIRLTPACAGEVNAEDSAIKASARAKPVRPRTDIIARIVVTPLALMRRRHCIAAPRNCLHLN